MSGSDTGAAPTAERSAWLRDLRRVDERQEDDLAGDFDGEWGEIEPLHHIFVGRFLSRLPPDGRVLDAACGTDKSDLQELPYRGAFDGVLCVDAMEFVPPEDWPVVLECVRRARSPSTIGAYGRAPSPTGTQPPVSTRVPSVAQRAVSSATRRVLPTPASPPTRTTAGSLFVARPSAASRT